MKNENREILKRDVEWLYKAINQNDIQHIRIDKNSAWASDGFRIHVINPLELDEDNNILDNIADAVPFEGQDIAINPKYLSEALSGFYPSEAGQVKIDIVAKGDIHMVRIVNHDQTKMALIACMERVWCDEQPD
jgi:hypothetical protein